MKARTAFFFLCMVLSGVIGFAQEIIVDAGASQIVTATAGATSYVWKLDGDDTGQTTQTFSFTPTIKDVGTHWLKAKMTFVGSPTLEQSWRLRVRIPIPTSTVNYYVATTGTDTNSGTLAAPFATLDKARDVIRALPRPLPAGGVSVLVRSGTYRRTSNFVLTGTDSGSTGAPVIYKAYPGETPVFTTGTPVSAASFTALDPAMVSRLAPGVSGSNIKQLDLTALGIVNKGPFPTEFDQNRLYNPYRTSIDGGIFEVFFNGSRQPLSRYPNDNLANRWLTPFMKMNGVLAKYATVDNGVNIGGKFGFNTTDKSHIQRWTTALTDGGVWLYGYWRVPWEVYGVKVSRDRHRGNTFTIDPGAALNARLWQQVFRLRRLLQRAVLRVELDRGN